MVHINTQPGERSIWDFGFTDTKLVIAIEHVHIWSVKIQFHTEAAVHHHNMNPAVYKLLFDGMD